ILHVGLVLVAFAGFTLAAAVSAFYLWQERRLKRRAVTILRRPAPSLATLDRLASRTVLVSLPALTLGLAVGLIRLLNDGKHVDAVVAATAVTWLVWAAYLVLRATRGWSGRRAAYVALAAVAALAEIEPEVEQALYRLRDHAAALHLFRVAAGLDSLVPGEGEILGQVRAAYEAGTTGTVLDRVFRQALHAGRKVRAQTAIGESPASVSSAAAALAE